MANPCRKLAPIAIALALSSACIALAQSYDPSLFAEMRWREIGPYRGGRTRALAGIPSQPNVFYIGAVNGGVWKTTDYGRTWQPIFDDQPTGSIGAIAVAPSDPNIIYVASGEGLHRPDLSTGDGIYKSIDGGKTWTHLGLRDGQQVPRIALDPRDPNRLFVAVLGHPYGPNKERGIYRSTDGGQTFEQILYKDENTGGSEVELDPTNSDIVYAGMWEAREGPWENSQWAGTNGGLFKSTDGGAHWTQLTNGLPTGPEGLVQVNVAIAPSNPQRIYISTATSRTLALYRSDDAGASWTRATDDPHPAARIGGGDLPVLAVDPKNPDIVYSASVVTWKSTDGAKTWTAIRGAPGGDDYQSIWINPNNPETILIVSDQGAIITVNGGASWSSWYTQPTAQMYHAVADNAFPYRVCSGQQESGSACVASRGDEGEITFRDWHPVGVEEYGYTAPDPLDPDIVYGGKVTRYDRRTGQVEDVSPRPLRPPGYRAVRTQPVLFSPIDPHLLYFAANTLWSTRDGGKTWREISPDLTRKTWDIPSSVGKYRDTPSAQPAQRGVIYALSPSPLDINLLWAGTDDGLIHMTIDGGRHWNNVTPPALQPWAKVSILDAGHFDRNTAYAAVNTFRLDDLRPHIYRTHDGGKTWTEIVNGIPDNAALNVVREDPKRKGLLYAGTERAVYVSFDDGYHWQSLRLNMPATSIRDLTIKDDDLIAATHGRGFWILDDVRPLRQIDASLTGSQAFLFRPQTALRVRWDTNTDTPLPPDVPAGQNPPDGAIIDYYLASQTTGVVTLEVVDGKGNVVRHYASNDPVPPIDPMLDIPKYWIRPPLVLSNAPGVHRFLWDTRYAPIPQRKPQYGMEAVVHDTPPTPTAPWVMPGKYTVRLTVNGQTLTQPLIVKMDPRVHTPLVQLAQQFEISKQIYDDLIASNAALEELRGRRSQLAQTHSPLEQQAAALEGEQRRGLRAAAGPPSFATANGALFGLLTAIQNADVAPTAATISAVTESRHVLAQVMERWRAFDRESRDAQRQ